MAYATSYSNFIGSIAVPNLVSTRPDGQLMTTMIAEYETEFLENFFGYEMAQEVTAEITTPDPTNLPYYNIVNGATYVDLNGDTQKWQGFKVGKSPIANYIYTEYLRFKEIQITGLGTVKEQSENAMLADGSMLLVKAWNAMVEMNCNLHNYLVSIKGDYPLMDAMYAGFKHDPYLMRYAGQYVYPNQLLFVPQNMFSL